jgi:UDP-glucose:glycoprotein glucosyltransferase
VFPFQEAHIDLTLLLSAAFTNLVSTAVSIVSDVRIPDPSEASLYNSPLSSRNTQYRKLSGEHTCG